MPDASIRTEAPIVGLKDLPDCCAICGGAAKGQKAFELSIVVADLDQGFRSLSQMSAPFAGHALPGLSENEADSVLSASKTVHVPYCAEHLASKESVWEVAKFGVALLGCVGVPLGSMYAAVRFEQPLFFLGMAPMFFGAWLISQRGPLSKMFNVEMVDTKTVVFRNVSPAFASALSQAEWKKVFGEDGPVDKGVVEPKKDNPFA
jgi:hypothetical protein